MSDDFRGTQTRFHCGDVIARADDPCHEGIVQASFGWTVRVRWCETDWREDCDLNDMVLVRAVVPPIQNYTAQQVRNRIRIGLPV